MTATRPALLLWLLLTVTACKREAAEEANEPAQGVSAVTPQSMPAPASGIARDQLLGAWSSDGENFAWMIDSTTILFESDMIEHPYQLIGDTLVIDRGDPAIGMQKTRIVRLTADTLIIEDVLSGASEALLRLR